MKCPTLIIPYGLGLVNNFEHDYISYEKLAHLEDVGLIRFATSGEFVEDDLPENNLISYYGRRLEFESFKKAYKFSLGRALFTVVGRELSSICGSIALDDYYFHMLSKWINEGYVISSPI
jgi:hypothetical protein